MTFATFARRGTAASVGLIIGQSNGDGHPNANPEPSKAVEGALYDEALAAWQTHYGANGRVSVETLLAPNRTVYKHGRAGTTISSWINNHIPTTIAAVNALGLTPDWVIWIQGEADCQDATSAAAYQSRWMSVLDLLYAEWGRLPVLDALLSGLPQPQFGFQDMINAAKTAVAALPAYDVEAIATDAFEKQADDVHYTRHGYDGLGRAFRTRLVARGL